MTDLSSGRIAWIDDDYAPLSSVTELIRRAGFRIDEYSTYSEAMRHVRDLQQVDLILLDLDLPPGRDVADEDYLGLKLLHKLRREFHMRTPVLVFTAFLEILDDLQREQLDELTPHTCSKPIRPSRLRDLVFDIVGRKLQSDVPVSDR